MKNDNSKPLNPCNCPDCRGFNLDEVIRLLGEPPIRENTFSTSAPVCQDPDQTDAYDAFDEEQECDCEDVLTPYGERCEEVIEAVDELLDVGADSIVITKDGDKFCITFGGDIEIV